MRRRVVHSAIHLALGATLFGAGLSTAAPHVERHERFSRPAPRAPQVLSARSLERLGAEGQSVLWVFFTDKAELDAGGFARAVRDAGNRVTERAKARRARETGGRFVADYYDLPVPSHYVDAVARTGARLRQVSRWLNAVSVVADRVEASRIAALPFVRVVTPARRSRRLAPESASPVPLVPGLRQPPTRDGSIDAPPRPTGRKGAMSTLPRPISYGASTDPLAGINAIAAHDSGWSAATVLVVMFDTGYDKNHNATSPLNRIAERDFIFGDGETANQPGDVTGQWIHGTGTWAVLGGYYPANIIGPAYNAQFALAKTEDIRSETPVEEDHWVAAVEWADSLGADVISSSLAYLDFDGTANDYAYTDLDGYTTVVSLGANMAARRGIVVATAMGNTGPAPGSIWAPADAESILAVGAVDSGNLIANFSAQGPTADGRIKPEVVAQGVSTYWAVAGSPTIIAPASGTSLATPLIGGAVALAREAHPEWTVADVRQALMSTADKAASPNNAYGWGRIDVLKAIYSSPLGPPVYPRPFNLLLPADNSVVTATPATFTWRSATDPQGGALTYTVELHSGATDSCLFMATTTESTIVFTGYLGPSKTYDWIVTGSDPEGHGRVSRDRFRFTTSSTTGVPAPGGPPVAPRVTLLQNRPNPIRSLTQIDYSLSGPAGVVPVGLRVFDASGRLVRTLVDGFEGVPADCSIRWDGRDENGRRAASGIYYYRLVVEGVEYSKRLVLLR